VELIWYMLDPVRLKVQKYQSWSQMHLPLKDSYETNRCLIVDRWICDGSDSVIVQIIVTVSLVIDDHVVQDNANTHDQSKSELRVRSARDD
jgi:hypothetical protein